MMTMEKAHEREEIEALLPWHAAGTLNRKDAQRVEQALAQDAGLARHYESVREELVETIRFNESLGAPSARAMQKLMAAIEADTSARTARVSFNFGAWIADKVSQLTPRTLAWSASAAALVLMLQAGILAGVYMKDGSGRSETQLASYTNEAGTKAEGAFALISFAPQASAEDVRKFLETNNFAVVDGPRNGLYKVRVAMTGLPKAELTKALQRLQAESSVVKSALATE
jgi:hypothetical protein